MGTLQFPASEASPASREGGLDENPASEPAWAVDTRLAPIKTLVPESQPIVLGAYYPDMRAYYPFCEMQTKRWCVRNIGRDWRIFDVGANIGYYSVLFARCAPEGRVVAFEPTETIEMLERNIALNGVHNVETRKVAMGEAQGARRDAIFRIWGSEAEVAEFPFSTVDAEMRRLGWDRLDLLKIDVDSFDLEVLKGSVETLDRFNPWVIVELNHALAKRQQGVGEALEWLASQGYAEALVLDGENFVLRRPESGMRTATEGLALRHEREPVYCRAELVALDAAAGVVASEPAQSGVGQIDAGAGALVIDGPAWSYGALWRVTPACTGPAIVELTVEVSGSDIGVLCVAEGYSELLGSEVFVAPGPATRVEITLDRVEELAGVVIRKGPDAPGVAQVRFNRPTVRQAETAQDADLPISTDPRVADIALAESARGLSQSPRPLPEARLEIVEAHRLGERLGTGYAVRPPMALVNVPLGHFRMETHDSKILAQIYRMRRPARHLEFGTWEGFGAALCARNCDAHVWTVNLPDGERDETGRPVYSDGAGSSDAGVRIGRLYREAGYADRVTQLLIDSRDFDSSAFGPGFFDSILVDGGHTADVVTNDTEKALRVLRPGGLLLWHDFCPDPAVIADHPASHGVVEAVLTNWRRWRPCFSSLFWIRPSWLLLGVANGAFPEDPDR